MPEMDPGADMTLDREPNKELFFLFILHIRVLIKLTISKLTLSVVI